MAEPVELAPVDLGAEGVAYERWLRTRPDTGGEYLKSETRVRFEARDGDVLVALPGTAVRATAAGVELHGGALPRPLLLPGVGEDAARRFFALLDGEVTLAQACRAAPLDRAERASLLAAAFGVVLFAPHAVTALEREVSGIDIVRFPGAPYEIERAYWENMAAVRRRTATLEAALGEPSSALRELSALHVVALLGENRKNFYRPASRVANNGVAPGTLWQAASRTVETPAGTRFLEGPRVHVPLLGGKGYGALLAELSGDPEATLERRTFEEEGLDWGRLLTGMAAGDREPATWFTPPRPITLEHVASLFSALSSAVAAASAGRRGAALDALADFHQRFVRLHPFRACNQALAMNVVNAVLARVTGAGMPHLVLDHLALRWSSVAYRRLFALAADAWCVPGAPAARLARLVALKRDYFALVGRMAHAEDAAAARVAAETAPEAARLALVRFD
ncbi:MAG TPA: hypothetical protein VMI54_25225 [Polyangiaceae bacterium]|nr:hypothetical protein [Polyangiaceae bacterium]